MASGKALGCGVSLAIAGGVIGVFGGLFMFTQTPLAAAVGLLLGGFGSLCFVTGFVLFVASFFMQGPVKPPPPRPLPDVRREQFLAQIPTGPFTQPDDPCFHVATAITKGVAWEDVAFLRVGAPVIIGPLVDTPAGPLLPVLDAGANRLIGYGTDQHAQAAMRGIHARSAYAQPNWGGRILHIERPNPAIGVKGGVLVQLWHENSLERYFTFGKV